MSPELQRAYDALQQADEAGNTEDAQQIADYIRELEAQQKQGDMIAPIGGLAVGTTAGAAFAPAVGKAVDVAATKVAEQITGPKGTPRGDSVAKWLATQTTGPNVGGATFEEAYKKSEIARGKPVQSRGSQIPMRRGALGITNQPEPPSLPQKAAANIIAGEKLGTPGVARRVAGMGVAGAEAGKMVSDIQQGNTLDAIISGIGAAGGAMSQSRIKPIRALGTGLSLLVPTVQGAGAVKDIVAPSVSEEEKEKKAHGGLVHLAEGGGKLGKAVSAAKKLSKGLNFDRFKMSEVYPDVVPPVMATDPKTGKQFLQKQLSPEAIEVQKARKLAQKEIDAGNYEPFFDIEKRFYADPSRYQLAGTTLTDIVPKKADTIAKYEQLANQPESLLRLRNAFNTAKDRPLAKDWYAMGQLEEAFIRELGPIEGPKQFRARFADAMAATTGGADPNSNLMMAAFTNYQKGLGKEIPTTAADLPFPIGGRFVSGNMEQAKKLQDIGLIPVTNPKRHNFSANFLGYRDRSTLDEQMSQLWDPKMMAPPPNAYGIYEQALAKEAKRAGVEPANFQDIAWAGAKDYPGKPMIREVNEMLARTNMITGEPQEEILKGYIRGNKPMYGIAGAGAGMSMDEEEEKRKAAGGSIQEYAKGKRVISAAKDLILPPAENAARTQIIGTLPTYAKAAEILKQRGASGRGIDVGAGLGEGSKILGPNFDTMEPYAKNWKPTFTSAEQMPSDAYGQLTNLNVMNVMPREARDELVQHMGRTMEPGGLGILTTRGADVMKAQGRPGPEPMSIITSRDTYQKGFTKQELEDYLRYMLGDKFDVNKINLGPAGAIIQKKAEGGSTTPAWQRAEGKNPEGGLNAVGRASYNRETGGNLKAPQPEGGSRKKSFCARMGGMKKKLTSSKTANDPDSRINKALRKWKC